MHAAKITIGFLFFEAPFSLEPICGSRPYFRQIPPPAPVRTQGRAGRIQPVTGQDDPSWAAICTNSGAGGESNGCSCTSDRVRILRLDVWIHQALRKALTQEAAT